MVKRKRNYQKKLTENYLGKKVKLKPRIERSLRKELSNAQTVNKLAIERTSVTYTSKKITIQVTYQNMLVRKRTNGKMTLEKRNFLKHLKEKEKST